jgi:hypothetical protein
MWLYNVLACQVPYPGECFLYGRHTTNVEMAVCTPSQLVSLSREHASALSALGHPTELWVSIRKQRS